MARDGSASDDCLVCMQKRQLSKGRKILLWKSIQNCSLEEFKIALCSVKARYQFNIDDPINSYGWTLLHCACYFGKEHILKFLVDEENSDINITNKNGWHGLTFAVLAGHLHIVDYLLFDTEVTFEMKDKDKKSAFDHALEQ
mmetsp:Transcript_7761/g.5821  ORF Transcript_7761/g.5821 Transcript_7761/m.5821 type:complete len:142 (+) Transcript_7761:20-445(+)